MHVVSSFLNNTMRTLIVIFALTVVVERSTADLQGITATGTLLCGEKPYDNATVKLVDIGKKTLTQNFN